MRLSIHPLLDRIPSRCPLCQLAAHGGHLCPGCEQDWFEQRQQRALCGKCGHDLGQADSMCAHGIDEYANIDALICAMDYALGGRALIQLYKNNRQLALAHLLAALMARAAKPWLAGAGVTAWVPIPASTQRLINNGFSPAQQLAQALARRTGIACRLDWLAQTREGLVQKSLTRKHRAQAVAGRFKADPRVMGNCVGLVDDVVTTASTVQAAAQALKAAGAARVLVLAAARTPAPGTNLAQSGPCFM